MAITLKSIKEHDRLGQYVAKLKLKAGSLADLEMDDINDNIDNLVYALDLFKKAGELTTQNFIRILKEATGNAEKLEKLKEISEAAARTPNPLKNVSPLSFLQMSEAKQNAVIRILQYLPKGKQLNQKIIDLIIEADEANFENPDLLSECITAMIKGNIPLTQFFGKSKLQQILAHPPQLENVTSLLNKLSAQKPNALDKKTFNHILENVKEIGPKAEAINQMFDFMSAHSKPIIGNRKSIMAIDADDLENINHILTSLAGEQPAEFNYLDKRTLEYVIKNASKYKETADDIANVFTTMRNIRIPSLVGIRAPVLNLNKQHLTMLNEVLGQLDPAESIDKALNKEAIKVLIKNLAQIEQNAPKNEEEIPDIKAYAKNLGQCIKAMQKNDISLVQIFSQDNLNKLLALNNDQLNQVNTIFASLESEEKALDERTFNFIVENAKAGNFSDKTDEISDAFEEIKRAGIALKGIRQPLMNLDKTQLRTLTLVLQEISGKPSLNKEELKTLFKNLGTINTEDHAEKIGQCIQAMASNHIRLTQTVGQNKLSRLMALPDRQLESIQQIFTSLTKDKRHALDERTFNYIMDIMEKGNALENKVQEIAEAFDAVAAANTPLTGVRQPIMNLSSGQIKNLTKIMQVLEDSANPLTQDEVKALIKKLPETGLSDEQAENLGTCIKAMQDNHIGLTQTLGQNKLTRLVGLDEGNLAQAAALLSELGKELDERTFNYIVDHVQNNQFLEKAPEIVKAFQSMKQAGIPLKGNRQPIMNLKKVQLENLNSLLGANSDEKIKEYSQSDFKAIMDCIKDSKNDNLQNLMYIYSLSNCIKIMQEHKIPLTQKIGTNNLTHLTKLNSNELDAVLSILINLQDEKGAINETIFDYLVDNASSLSAKDADQEKTKAELCTEAFLEITNAGLEIKGHRRVIMKMASAEIQQLRDTLAMVNEQEIKVSKAQLNELCKISPIIAKSKNKEVLENCVTALLSADLGLTQTIGTDRIKRLAALPKTQLEGIEKILTNLAEDGNLDSKTFDYLVNNAPQLSKRADIIVQAFDKLRDVPMAVKGNRQPLMNFIVANQHCEAEEVLAHIKAQNAPGFKHKLADIISKSRRGMSQPIVEEKEVDEDNQNIIINPHK